MSDTEYSESGAPIFRHDNPDREFDMVSGDEENIEHISNHLERHIGKVDTVFHELVSDAVHVDIHMVKPTPQRHYHTLITSGMSERPMQVPEGFEECRYAELLLCLPPDWPISEAAFKDENHYWPIRWLKILARMPHFYNTWLFTGHTIPNDDPPKPFADNTELCCMLLLPPVLFPDAFHTLSVADDKIIHFLSVLPLYQEEVDFKLKFGVEALLDRFDELGMSELVDLNRPNVCG